MKPDRHIFWLWVAIVVMAAGLACDQFLDQFSHWTYRVRLERLERRL